MSAIASATADAARSATTAIPSDSDEKYATKDYVDENSVLPSYQSDEPGQNVGGLEARIRQEMETRIRAEMEQKIRQEMKMDALAKKQQEAEEEAERAVKKAKRKLEQMKEERHLAVLQHVEERYKQELIDPIVARVANIATQQYHQMWRAEMEGYQTLSKKTIEIMKARGVLYYYRGMNQEYTKQGEHRGCPPPPVARQNIFIFVTPERMEVCSILLGYSDKAFEIEYYPFYWFDSELQLRDLAILDHIFSLAPQTNDVHKYGFTCVTHAPSGVIHSLTLSEFGASWNKCIFTSSNEAPRTLFEKYIRLIPGSYRNGPWKPVNTLLGHYFNEDTLEFSAVPPAME